MNYLHDHPHASRVLLVSLAAMALHRQVTATVGTAVYFCDAHSPWQRGSNENTNGLLRDYFPKATDLGAVTPEELAHVADEINHRPRKTLDWARPADLLRLAVGDAAHAAMKGA